MNNIDGLDLAFIIVIISLIMLKNKDQNKSIKKLKKDIYVPNYTEIIDRANFVNILRAYVLKLMGVR